MDVIRAILVDDEPRARRVLRNLLGHKDYSMIDVVAECSGVLEAVDTIKEQQPQLVFLDVQMPKYAGYEIVDFFDAINFEIIFITAFDNYAIKAFELCAVDYLVKPIKRERLKQAIGKVALKLNNQQKIEQYDILNASLKKGSFEKLIVPELNNRRIINLQNIVAVQADGSYTTIHLKEGNPITTSKNLKYYQDVFSNSKYLFRSHRSWIVNINYLKHFNRTTGFLDLEFNIVARISRNSYADFESLIQPN